MDEFSKGNFAAEPQVEWQGDFKGIRDSFVEFEKSMSTTVKSIQRVADEVADGSQRYQKVQTDLQRVRLSRQQSQKNLRQPSQTYLSR